MKVRPLFVSFCFLIGFAHPGFGFDLLENASKELPKAHSVHWPGWRGHNTLGIADGHPLPKQFTNDKGVHYKWVMTIPGRGNSSPVIWGDRIFVTSASLDPSRRKSDGSQQERLVLMAMDKNTGNPLWNQWVADVGGPTHLDNGYASSTVVTDGETVFVFSGYLNAGLYAFDARTGKKRWGVPFGAMSHQYGFATSPVLFENLVIQVADSNNKSLIAAFDKRTGQTVWKTPRKSHGSWSTPLIVRYHFEDEEEGSQAELIVNGGSPEPEAQGHITSYDPRTGTQNWDIGGTTAYVCPAPILGSRHVFSSSGRYTGPLNALRPGLLFPKRDSSPWVCEWSDPTAGPYIPTGIFYRKRLYMISDQGVLVSYDPERKVSSVSTSGGASRRVWQRRMGSGSVTSSLLAGDGKIYVANTEGKISVVEASDSFRLIGLNDMRDPIHATPAISEGSLYVRTDRFLFRIDEDLKD